MNTLFPLAPAFPPGFFYQPEFITEEEENNLLATIRQIELRPLMFQGYTALRKVRSFGYDYNFDKRSIAKGDPIPQAFNGITEKVADRLKLPLASLAELLVTEYPPGSVINWHRDAPPFGVIAGVSLLSDVNFKLRPHDKIKQNRKATITFRVERRSLYILQEEARNEWQHSTAPVPSVRYSITFRTLRQR